MLLAAGDKGTECGANLFELRNRIREVRKDADGRKQAFVIELIDTLLPDRQCLMLMVGGNLLPASLDPFFRQRRTR